MIKFKQIIETFLFCSFFGIGITAIAVSALSQEVVDYYHNKTFHENALVQIEEIKELCHRCDEQISFAKSQPQALERLRAVQFGETPQSNEETYYPKASEEFDINMDELLSDSNITKSLVTTTPQWLNRINQRKQKLAMFILGAILVLVAFTFFGGVAQAE